MTHDALLVLRSLFTTIWSLFTSFFIPGTNTTPAEFAFFLVFAFICLKFFISGLNSFRGL